MHATAIGTILGAADCRQPDAAEPPSPKRPVIAAQTPANLRCVAEMERRAERGRGSLRHRCRSLTASEGVVQCPEPDFADQLDVAMPAGEVTLVSMATATKARNVQQGESPARDDQGEA